MLRNGIIFALLIGCGQITHVVPLNSSDLVFVIVSQPEPFLHSIADFLRHIINNKMADLDQPPPTVLLSHIDLPVAGGWTLVPLLRPLADKFSKSSWVIFLEPNTVVRCEHLLSALASYHHRQEVMWVGHPLYDEEPTIIHHFAMYDELPYGLPYPSLASGFAMRMELVKRLTEDLASGKKQLEGEFSIDPAFELAQLVYGGQDDPGPLLVYEPAFCLVSSDDCATVPEQYITCGSITEDSILFAVKTWSGFHSTRAKIVKKTWGKHVTHLLFYSDTDDPSLPAVAIGVTNSKRGHCEKTLAILKDAVQRASHLPKVKWILLADDDTILGVRRLCEALSCLHGGDALTVLGERYGYGYGRKPPHKGYDYITGGGGTVLSVAAAARAASSCACASRHAPDDMTLGACARDTLGISLTHCHLFHQARPQDYSRELLSLDRPVSFHKHWMLDPVRTYNEWFLAHDVSAPEDTHHDEL